MSKLTARVKRCLKREMGKEKPTVWVGKARISQELIEEVNNQLENRETVKVKILKNALQDAKAGEIAAEISRQTEAELVEVRGHTFILYKRRRRSLKK
ncbi:MAG: YhbY family RNA-binding protein [Candidatus Bathyarchaeia archaeon]